MDLTEKDKSLMNDILSFNFENQGKSFTDSYAAEELDIDVELYRFLYDSICTVSNKSLDILVCQQFNDKSFNIVSFDKIRTERFLNDGGFLNLKERERIATSNINFIGGDNYGNQSSNSDFINPTIQNNVNKTANEPSKKSPIEKVSWIVGIIVGLILIYEFIIKSFT